MFARAREYYYNSVVHLFCLPRERLSVSRLKAFYHTEHCSIHAVDGVDFLLEPNQCIGIVGESGCGKSSLGAALMRSLTSPGTITGGRILLGDVNLVEMSDREFDSKIRWKRIAMVFQGAMNTLDPVYAIESQLKEILLVHKFEGDYASKITQAVTQVGLNPSVLKLYPHELSGGMKQRVVIAMALLLEPDILIADEPTTALDVLVQRDIMYLLRRMRKESAISIILITHDLALVSEIADKVGIMYAGQIVEFGDAKQIYEHPMHPYTRALIAAVPRLKSKNRTINFIPGNPPGLCDPAPGCRFMPRCSESMEVCSKDPVETRTASGHVLCWLYEKDGSQR